MRDELKHLWTYRTLGCADRGWTDWYRRAVRSRIEPLVTFAKRLAVFAHGIVAHARWPLHTSLLEGINTRSRSSSEWPTAYATTPFSSSRSAVRSQELPDEPKNNRRFRSVF
jgi:transposase